MANREKGAHGGVAIIQSLNVISNVKNCFSDNFICTVEVKTATYPILVVCLYIPPVCIYHLTQAIIVRHGNKYLTHLEDICNNSMVEQLLMAVSMSPLLTGSLTSTSHDIENFVDFLIQNNFSQTVQDGIHEGDHTLALVFANFDDLYLPLNIKK